MKPGWGIGMIVAVLVSVAMGLIGSLPPQATISLLLLLAGLWTILAALFVVDRKDRSYYSAWGVVIAALSLAYLIPLQYQLALILLAIVALIIINIYIGRTPKLYEAATSPSPPAGPTPAAKG
ncbi:MAG: hypothetical protein JRN06_01065 [Nitrososphaerota archaeon]|nr:hypothetical protein [Nitrososphaerota archaeon]MDG7023557.1 hypothetical protein [Nitrososphaerota archaeon]